MEETGATRYWGADSVEDVRADGNVMYRRSARYIVDFTIKQEHEEHEDGSHYTILIFGAIIMS